MKYKIYSIDIEDGKFLINIEFEDGNIINGINMNDIPDIRRISGSNLLLDLDEVIIQQYTLPPKEDLIKMKNSEENRKREINNIFQKIFGVWRNTDDTKVDREKINLVKQELEDQQNLEYFRRIFRILRKEQKTLKVEANLKTQILSYIKSIPDQVSKNYNDKNIIDKRTNICMSCPFYKEGIIDRCAKCGCNIYEKIMLKNETCPINKW